MVILRWSDFILLRALGAGILCSACRREPSAALGLLAGVQADPGACSCSLPSVPPLTHSWAFPGVAHSVQNCSAFKSYMGAGPKVSLSQWCGDCVCCRVGGGERKRQCSLGEWAGGIKQGYCGCLNRLVLFILNGSWKTLPGCAKCTFVDAVDKICLFITSFLFSAILVLHSRLLLADFWGGLGLPASYIGVLPFRTAYLTSWAELAASEHVANSRMERSVILE